MVISAWWSDWGRRMTPDDLQALIDGGETLGVEFKGESHAPFSDSDLIDAVVCLANGADAGPSWLLVGVEDDGRISGARPRHGGGQTDLNLVRALIANRTQPALTVRIEQFATASGAVLAIQVPAAQAPTSTSDGRFLQRTIGGDGKPACRPLYFQEMQARQADQGRLDYSALPFAELGRDALDPLEFARYRRAIRENRGDMQLAGLDDRELAGALHAVQVDHGREYVTALGLLLFGREDALAAALPTHEVAIQVLSGGEVEVNDFVRWPLLRVMEEVEARLRTRNREREILVGMTRIGVPDYSPRAFREAVANALTHRDYTRLGAVHVQWYEDRIEISNPGGFPQGVRLDNLLVAEPSPRNFRLADAFKRAGLVERTARGIDTLFEQQISAGRAAPSYGRSTEARVVLVLPGGEPNLPFVQARVEEERARGPLSLDDLLILNELRIEPRITIHEAAARVQKPIDEVRLKLAQLRERGLLESGGAGDRARWRLAAAFRHRIDAPAGARAAPADVPERERLVLQYAADQGSVTRREVVELCGISARQAAYVLSRLAQRGDLVMHGARRGAWYEPN